MFSFPENKSCTDYATPSGQTTDRARNDDTAIWGKIFWIPIAGLPLAEESTS
jgi:hypothetical protein